MIYKKSWNYILVKDNDYYRLKALKDFSNIKKGDLGSYISKFIPRRKLSDLYFYQNYDI